MKLAVIGNPIKHSKSPEIHAEFAKQAGIEISFQKVEVSLENCNEWVESFFKEGGKGLSVTLPLKYQCIQIAD